jgi:mono/diheme cytochrome c family protein
LIVEGEPIYVKSCAICHGEDGEGLSKVFPPLNRTEWVTEDKNRLILLTLHGLRGPIVVRGEVFEGVMPAFGNWDDREIAAVLSYIRNAWDNEATIVSESMIKLAREMEEPESGFWTAEDLNKKNYGEEEQEVNQ